MYILFVSETLITADQSVSAGAPSGKRDESMMQVLPFIRLRDESKEWCSPQPRCPVLMSSSSHCERDGGERLTQEKFEVSFHRQSAEKTKSDTQEEMSWAHSDRTQRRFLTPRLVLVCVREGDHINSCLDVQSRMGRSYQEQFHLTTES